MPIIPNTFDVALPDVAPTSLWDAVFKTALSKPSSGFSLNPLGVSGFFGGDSAVYGMATTSLIWHSRWFGWYNTPGSYEIAKRFGPLARWKLCDGLFPGGEHDPARLFEIEGMEGPAFLTVHSGSNFPRTGHLAHLIASKADGLDACVCTRVGKRVSTTATVTVVRLPHVPGVSEQPSLNSSRSVSAYYALMPIVVSLSGGVACALVADWYCFASIVLGILAHGFACFVIGSGNLTLVQYLPPKNAPPGDGVMMGESGIVVLLGEEAVVNVVTLGHFKLKYREKSEGPKA